jgi:hypothetical protein
MRSRVLALDTILSAALYFAGKWQPALKRNQSRELLRFLLCRLYDQGRGELLGTHLTLAQGTLAQKLGLSRQWVGILLARLQRAGWVEFYAPTLDGGMNGSTILGIGPQLKRLLVMLAKSGRRKTSVRAAAKSRWHFSPSQKEKTILFRQQKENAPPPERILTRIPLLKAWMERGTPANV